MWSEKQPNGLLQWRMVYQAWVFLHKSRTITAVMGWQFCPKSPFRLAGKSNHPTYPSPLHLLWPDPPGLVGGAKVAVPFGPIHDPPVLALHAHRQLSLLKGNWFLPLFSISLFLAAMRPWRRSNSRAGHCRYFLMFSIIKNDFFAFFIRLITCFCTSPI